MFESEKTVTELFATVRTDYFESAEITREDDYQGVFLTLNLLNSTVKIKIRTCVDDKTTKICFSGDTLYFSFGKWYTFSRRGIEDSFYSPWDGDLSKWDINEVVAAQIKRAEDAIVKAQASGPRITIFPGISVTQARLDEDAVKVNNFKKVVYLPGGMGTGYEVSRAPVHYSRPVPVSVQNLLKCKAPLYYTTIDHD